MKSLIRKILNEFVDKDVITLEELNIPNSFFNSLINEGRSTVSIPKGLEKELMDYIRNKFNWPPTIDKKWCSDIKEKEDKENNLIRYSCNKKFDFKLTNHWLQRLFRKDEPEYKPGGRWSHKNIINPTKKEGINLFFNSKEKINDYIDNAKNWSPNESKFILLSQNNYQLIIALKKEKKGDYTAEFITQIKGERFFDTPELKKTTYL